MAKAKPTSRKAREAFAKFLASRKEAARLPKDAIYDEAYVRAAAMLDAEDFPSRPLQGSAEVGKEARLKDSDD